MIKHIHGGDVYRYKDYMDFSANCNPLGMPEGVIKAICQAVPQAVHYPDVQCTELIQALSGYEGVDEPMVYCGNGAAEVIFSLCLGIKPREAVIPAPTFAEYEQALESVDCKVNHVFLTEEDGFVPGEDLLKALTDRVDVLFFCNPNNPTGVLTSRDYMEKLLKSCRKHNILLVIDECFLDFVENPRDYSMKDYLKEYKNLFILKAFTKRYAMAGIRLGYGLCGDRELLDKMELVTQPWNVSGIAQAAGIAALRESEYVRQGREMVFREQAYLKGELEKLGYKLYDSRANYIFFRGMEELSQAMKEKKILIRDCSNYPGLSQGYYRIAVRTHEENRHLIEALAEIQST